MFPLTGTLRNKTLGILGLGNIGKAIARRAEPFGLTVIYHGRNQQAVPYAYVPSPLELAERSDILMIVVPGGDETFHLVNANVIRALGPDGVLINIARGTVVDEAALIAALRDRAIHTAAIDAFEFEPHAPPELIGMPHLVLTPHIGSGTHYTRELMSQAVVDNLIAWADRRPLPSPMNS
jgi:lactate dehydrogenase-like 2-hydroxyacid dehydrogenase